MRGIVKKLIGNTIIFEFISTNFPPTNESVGEGDIKASDVTFDRSAYVIVECQLLTRFEYLDTGETSKKLPVA